MTMSCALAGQHVSVTEGTVVNVAAPPSDEAAAEPAGPRSLDDLRQGIGVEGDSGISPLTLPAWMDLERCLRTKRFFEEHAFSLVLAWHCSLVMGFSLPSLLSALVFTHASETPKKSLERYMRTFAHLVEWHLGNIFDPSSRAFASIQTVRQLHAGVRAGMESSMPGKAWVSMYDMACVQSGFMGAITILPRKFGIRASKNVLADYVFFWRCTGYRLGVADKFNLCSLGQETSDKVVWEVIREVVLPELQHPPPQYSPIASAYVDGLNLMFFGLPIFSVHSTLAFSYWALGLRRSRLGYLDSLRYFYLRLLAFLIGLLPPLRWVMNRSVLSMGRSQATRLPESSASPGARCPFSGREGGAPCAMSSHYGQAPQPGIAPQMPSLGCRCFLLMAMSLPLLTMLLAALLIGGFGLRLMTCVSVQELQRFWIHLAHAALSWLRQIAP